MATFPPVTSDSELLLDCLHYTILHTLRVINASSTSDVGTSVVPPVSTHDQNNT